MNESELRALYTEAVKIIRQERKMREYVFRGNSEKLAEKLEEIDHLLLIVAAIKDAAKQSCEPQVEQMALIPPAVKYE